MVVERTATRLPRDPGEAGWNALAGPYRPARYLDADIQADWLVIGGGFSGLAAARELSRLRPDDNIVLLEARRVGQGPGGRNSGFMIDLPHDISSDGYAGAAERDAKETAMNRLAIDFSRTVAEDYGFSSEVFHVCGKINAAATDGGLRHNREYADHLASMDEDYRLLDRAEMRELTGIDYYQGGLFTPGAAMIQPAMFVRQFANGLSESVDIYEETPVTSLQGRVGLWTATTPKGSVSAPKVILAVNGHAESFGYYKRRLMHVFTYASMTRQLNVEEVKRLGGAPVWAATPADPMGTTVRRISGTGGDRIIVRNRFTYDPGMEVSRSRLDAVKKDHIRSFRKRFTSIEDVEMEYSWGGRLCLSWNGVPAFGELDRNLFSACCQNGVGVAKGTFSGIMAARLATETDDPMLGQLAEFEPPKRLPPEPLAWFGANLTIRWKEMQAGREL